MERKRLKEYFLEGEEFKLPKLPSEDFIFKFVFFTAESLPCSETQPSKWSFWRVKVDDFEYYGQRNYVLNGNLIYVIRNVSCTFDFKKLLENALRFVTDVVLDIFPCSAEYTRVDGPTMLEV